MNLKTLSSEGKIAYLIKPILKVLQEAGGQLERSEIKERIADMDDQIAEYSVLEKKSKQTGNTYKEFNFKFNFAIKDLYFNDFLMLISLMFKKKLLSHPRSIGKNSAKTTKRIKLLMSATMKKKLKPKKKSKTISRKICLPLLLKCHQKSLKLFQERY